jgi:hypothetical protein
VDVYILDSLLRRIEVVDSYESLIWTERFSAAGDFQMRIASSLASRSLLTEGTQLAIKKSNRVMTVESVQDSIDADGKDILEIKGPSLEAVLSDRVAFKQNRDLTNYPDWILSGPPADVCRQVFDWICRLGKLSPYDVIPFLQPGKFYADSTLPEPTTSMTVSITPGYLYDLIKNICDANELGFRLVRSAASNLLYFDVYAGNDLTTRQGVLPAVVFSTAMDDLQNTTELTTVSGSKNVAYVYSPAGFEIVYGDYITSDIDGFNRRVMYVDGSSVTLDNPDISGALYQLGYDALRANRASQMFDGEVNQYGSFVYESDYFLGDLVEVRNKYGVISYKRVTEQIFSSDENGERSYPTLSADLFAGSGDWLELDGDQRTWLDLEGDPVEWSNWAGVVSNAAPPTFVPQAWTDDFNRPDGPLTDPWYDWVTSSATPLSIVNHKVKDGLVSLLDLNYDNFQIDFDFDTTGGWDIYFQGPHGLPQTTEATWYQLQYSHGTTYGSAYLNHYDTATVYSNVAAGSGVFPVQTPTGNHFTLKAVNGELYVTVNGVTWSARYTPVANLRTIGIQSEFPHDGGFYNFSVKEVLA